MSEFPTVRIKGKEYKRKIIGYDSLTPKQKEKLREFPHLWKLGYCGSIIEGDTVLEVYKPLSSMELNIALAKEEEDEEPKEELETEEIEQQFIYDDIDFEEEEY